MTPKQIQKLFQKTDPLDSVGYRHRKDCPCLDEDAAFNSVDKATMDVDKESKILGVDLRERTFIRKYIDARKKHKQYKSILFKKSPKEVVLLLENDREKNLLIESLIDLRNLINEHIAIDLKDLVGDI